MDLVFCSLTLLTGGFVWCWVWLLGVPRVCASCFQVVTSVDVDCGFLLLGWGG